MSTPSAPNPISLLDVQGEFDGSNPISIDEYYEGAGTGYVTSSNYSPAGQVPSSGAISLANFRGLTKNVAFIFNDTITASTVDGYSLTAKAQTAGWNQTVPLIATVTINPGVTVTGPSGFSGAFTTLRLSPYPAGSSLTIINNGTIAGLGGAAGSGGNSNATSTTAGGAGGNGYTGLYIYNIPTSMYNNGVIGGGGGGGGGGGAARATATLVQKSGNITQTWSHSGGGGGGGRSSGTAGAGGTATGAGVDWPGPGNAGNAGTYTTNGTGGTAFAQQTMISGGTIRGGAGGAGGGLGASGANGGAGVLSGPYDVGSVSGGGLGGAAGPAITGGANITWYAGYGPGLNILGTIDNPGTNAIPGGVNNHADINIGHACSAIGCNSAAWVVFYSDGDERGYTQGNVLQYNSSWYSPESVGIGSSYWIRATAISGSPNTGDVLNSWLPLTATRSWGLSAPNIDSCTIRVQISNSSSGTTILFDVNYNISIEGGGF